MKKLVIGEIPDDFDFYSHIPVSPLCFSKKPLKEFSLKSNQFLNPYLNSFSTEDYDKLVTSEALGAVNYFAEKFNPDIFKLYSFEFWRIIYFPTLYILISIIRKHKIILDEIIVKYKCELLEVSIINDSKFQFSSIEELFDKFDVSFQEKLFSILIGNAAPVNFRVLKKNYNNELNKIENKEIKCKLNFKQKILHKIDSYFHRSKRGYGINMLTNIYLHLLLTFKKKIILDKGNSDFFFQQKLDDESLNLITLLFPQNERNVSELINSLSEKKFSEGKISLVSNTLFYSIYDKVLAALKIENKELVIAVQHGGHSYGSAKTFEFINTIELSVGGFFSWGWDQINGNKFNNVFKIDSPYLSAFKEKRLKSSWNNNIIVVGTIIPVTFPRFECNLASFEDCLKYRQNKVEFLSILQKSSLKSDLYYRYYETKQYALKDKEYCLSKIPDLKLIHGNLHSELLNCKLVILDHPGTTWNLTFAANIPTILFWDPTHFVLSSEAEAWLSRLKDVGVYYDNPTEAAEFICNNSNEILIWWNSHEIQEIRKLWVNEYARVNFNWLKSWTKTINSLNGRNFTK